MTKFHFWPFQKWPKISFWTRKKFKTAKNTISRKNFLIYLISRLFFCLDLFKFSGPLCNTHKFHQPFFYNTKHRNNHTLISLQIHTHHVWTTATTQIYFQKTRSKFGMPHFCGDTLVSLYIKILFIYKIQSLYIVVSNSTEFLHELFRFLCKIWSTATYIYKYIET